MANEVAGVHGHVGLEVVSGPPASVRMWVKDKHIDLAVPDEVAALVSGLQEYAQEAIPEKVAAAHAAVGPVSDVEEEEPEPEDEDTVKGKGAKAKRGK